jgi:sortase (surface protein transpeptidase)
MARYIPKHMRKQRLRDHRRATGVASVLVAGLAGLSGSFGYVPGASAIDPAKPLAAQVQTALQPLPIAVPTIQAAIDVQTSNLPLYVNIPAIGVGSELIELGIATDGELEVPTDFNQAGWFSGGAVPGEPGPAVIAGHLDSVLGPAIFWKLSLLKPGDIVKILRRDSKVLTFSVTWIDRVRKDYFPSDQVYGPTPNSELRLITCGGTFNKSVRSYNDNTIVYAKLIS